MTHSDFLRKAGADMTTSDEPEYQNQCRIDKLALQLFEALSKSGDVLVTAESCTAGLIAASLARVPGMSDCLAGGFVVYQNASKVNWLSIPPELIDRCDAVSCDVARVMAENAMHQTPHASIGVSITGHLGPQAPAAFDGIAWMGLATRKAHSTAIRLVLEPSNATEPTTDSQSIVRCQRQQNAVIQVLQHLLQYQSTGAIGEDAIWGT
jgi:nicotinamide-nucleotide amidase